MSVTQHLPAGPGPPALLLLLGPLALGPVPLGGLLLGVRFCWAPALPALSSLGSGVCASLCDSVQLWPSSPGWWWLHPRVCCSEPSGRDTGLSRAPAFRLCIHVLAPGLGLLAPPTERSRGVKSECCRESGAELAVEAPDSPFSPSEEAGVGLVAGMASCLSVSLSSRFCAHSSSALGVFVVLWLPSWLCGFSSSFMSYLRALPVSLSFP